MSKYSLGEKGTERQGSFKNTPIRSKSFQESYLQNIHEDEEDDMVPYTIREEIIQKVMDEIYIKYLDKESVNFVVECAYDALVKFLNMEFYFHHQSEPYYKGHPLWSADDPPEPSVPDNLSSNRVAVEPSPPEEIIEPEIVVPEFPQDLIDVPPFEPFHPVPTEVELMSVSLLGSTTGDKTYTDHDTTDFDLDEDIIKYLMGQKDLHVIEEYDTPTGDGTNRLAQEAGIGSILNAILEQVDRETEGSEKNFIQFAKTLKLTGPCVLTRGVVQHKDAVKLPKIELPQPKKFSRKQDYIEALPAIRLETKFDSCAKPEPERETEKGKTKSKSPKKKK